MYQYAILLVSAVFFVFLPTIQAQDTLEPPLDTTQIAHYGQKQAGALTRVELVGRYSQVQIALALLQSPYTASIQPSNGVDLYTVTFWTTNYDGTLTEASGLIGVPQGRELRAVVSFQTGTNPYRPESMSLSDQGLLPAAVFGGSGYLSLTPDYIGLGVSSEPQSYLYAPTTAETVIDLMKAAYDLIGAMEIEWSNHVLLTGFSQGGHATMAVHRELEQRQDERFQVVGSAPIAGPNYLLEVGMPYALTGRSSGHLLYLALVTNSYSRVYQQPLNSVVAAPYADKVPELLDGTHPVDEILAALPQQPTEFFTPEVLKALTEAESHWFTDALAANETHNWHPRAPIRLYYGEADLDVSPEESRRAADEMAARGAAVEAISVGDVDHNGTLVNALPEVHAWFESLIDN